MNDKYLFFLGALLAAYLLGSLSFAVIVSRCMGLQDPRSYGSQNPGATNVLRSGSKVAALSTLLLDAAKGWLAVMLVQCWGEGYGLGEGAAAAAGLAAFIGHLYPVFFKFQGGKGVATAAGVLLGINPWLGLATLCTWLIVAYASRYSSLAALASAVFAPLYYLLGHRVVWYVDQTTALVLGVIAILLVARHRKNIARLVRGQEPRLGKAK